MEIQTLSLQQSMALATQAIATARDKRYRPMAIVVLDATGTMVMSVREDGASALRLEIALGKASAAIGMGISSRTLAQRAQALPIFFGAIATVAQRGFIPQTGALLVKDTSGQVLGVIGASGGSGDEDEEICQSAIESLGWVAG
jgi:uncharacterized protein GlcG (DUF336 family)